MPRHHDLYARWLTELRHSRFFQAGERVGVAVSGGPDSILLFDFMNRAARELGLTISAVHFNHHLRGAESDADEEFVRGLARHAGVAWHRNEGDVARAARESKRNLEATARDLRYRFFNSLINQGKVDKVATAHTASDQAETVLLRLLRGTGNKGLGGIYPSLDGKIFRPFLGIARSEIELEVKQRNLEFRIDSTNKNPKLRRNRIRMELLPLLVKDYNPAIVRLLKEFADRARDDEEVMELLAHERGRPWRVREGGGEKVAARPFAGFPAAVGRRVLRQMLAAVRGHLRGITFAHVEAIRRFAIEAQSGKKLELPGGLEARREFDWLILGSNESGGQEVRYSYPVCIPGKVDVPEVGLTFRFEIIEPGGAPKAYNDSETVGIDPHKLSGQLVLRNWRAGDKFWVAEGKRPRNFKVFFSKHKIPGARRQSWPVLACGEKVIWAREMTHSNGRRASSGIRQVLIRMDKAESKS